MGRLCDAEGMPLEDGEEIEYPMNDLSIGHLAAALAKAQAEFVAPPKNKTAKVRSDKGNYEYHYADLADIFEAIRKPLTKNELAVSQNIGVFDGVPALETRLMHSSGEQIVSYWPLPTAPLKPQEWGSLLTYYRRYALSAAVGIAADEDEDGNMVQAASGSGSYEYSTASKTASEAAAPVAQPAPGLATEPEKATETPTQPTVPTPKDAAPPAEDVFCKKCGKKMAATDVKVCVEQGIDPTCWKCRRKKDA